MIQLLSLGLVQREAERAAQHEIAAAEDALARCLEGLRGCPASL